ncbi:MAG: ABC transporter substrate-binding protein, partial [Myxococcota bacterium]
EIVKLSLIKRAYDLHPFNMTCKKLSNENPVRMRCQVSEGKRQQTIQLMLNTYDGHWRIYDVQVGQKKLLHDYSRQLNALIKRWTVNGLIERLRIRHKQLLRDIRRRARSSLRQTSIQENTSKSAD